MIEGITIRPAAPREHALLSEIAFRSKAHWGYSEAFMQACRDELTVSEQDIANPRLHYFVIEMDGAVRGYYAVECRSGDEYELEALFVEPDCIGKGLGRALMEHAKSRARRLGAQFLLIQSDPNATAFYAAAGGEPAGERPSDSIPGRSLPLFRIPLNQALR